MKYAVYVKFETEAGSEGWTGIPEGVEANTKDEARAFSLQMLGPHLKKVGSKRIIRAEIFPYNQSDTDAADFADAFQSFVEDLDLEEENKKAPRDIARRLSELCSMIDVCSMRIANKIHRDDHGSGYKFMKIAAIATLTMLGAQIALLLWLILR